jgi:hypothetical protein
MMVLHDYPKRGNMVVMDGNRVVATCRSVVSGGFLLKVYAGSWVDPRARTQGLFPGKFPGLMVVQTRKEAKAILTAVARTGR